MREVKFRGKSEYKDVWHYGSLINNAFFLATDMSPVLYILDTDDLDYDNFTDIGEQLEHFKVIPETVGQYTGLKDKNDTGIYEGDVINKQGHFGFYIEFRRGVYRAVPLDKVQRLNWVHRAVIDMNLNEWKVIGNIYEDNHLLEGDSDE